MSDEATTGEQLCAELKETLARFREKLAAIEPGSGFDQQRSMLSSWIKEGERLLSRID